MKNNKRATLLLLGGTADGRVLAETLHAQGVNVIYSIAGLVRTPNVACEVISGGFSQRGGLALFIKEHLVTAILDVTHPYAQKMSTTAVTAAKQCGIPCWRFHRAQWEPKTGDQWHHVDNWDQALPLLKDKRSVLLTAGQIEQDWLNRLCALSRDRQKQWLRTAVPPKVDMPPSMEWIKAIGPFAYEDEYRLIQGYNADVLLSKNSGGDATVAKLEAARALNIPVVMLKRPELANADQLLFSRDECRDVVLDYFNAL